MRLEQGQLWEAEDGEPVAQAAADRECETLLEAATPELYRRNAFRVTGLPVTIGMREVKRRLHALKAAKRLGLPAQPSGGGYLPFQPPLSDDEISAAIRRLQDPEARLIDEFFWFWPQDLNTPEDEALRFLKDHRVNDARDVWFRWEYEGSQSRISTHNLAVLSHVAALDLEYKAARKSLTMAERRNRDVCWAEAYKRWAELLRDEWFWTRLTARIRQLDDPRLTTGTARRIRHSLPKALLSINAQLAVRAADKGSGPDVRSHLRWMRKSGFGDGLAKETLRGAVGPTRARIRLLCEEAERHIKDAAATADQAADRLLENGWPLLRAVDLIFRPGDPLRDNMRNDVAKAGRNCTITYGNLTQDWRGCLRITLAVLPLAISDSVRRHLVEDTELLFTNFCGAAAVEAAANGRYANRVVRHLLKDATPLLDAVARLFPEEHPVRKHAFEAVVAVAQKGIVIYGKETEQWAECLDLIEAVRPISVSTSLHAAVEEGVRVLSPFRKRRPARPPSPAAPTPRGAATQPPETQTSGLAIASLILGLLSLCSMGLSGIPGLILGAAAIRAIENGKGRVVGQGMAVAGIILSALGILLLVLSVAGVRFE